MIDVAPSWKPSEPDTLWTAKQAAAFLQVHERTVIRWAAAGEIPALRLGRCWRFVPYELNRWAHAESSKSVSPVRRNDEGRKN